MRIPFLIASRHVHPVARVLMAVLAIAIFEGAIRKWVSQASTLPLMALRDGLVAYALVQGLRRGWLRFSAWPEALLLAWTALVLVWATLQVMAQLQPPLIAIVGLRSWLLYLWFAWLCRRTLARADVEYVLRMLALLVIPLAMLALLQHQLPPAHFLNRSPEGDEDSVVTVVWGIVRVTGTFTHPAGYAQLTYLTSTLALALLWGELKGFRSKPLRWAVVAAAFICVVVSGSRSAFLGAGIIALVSFGAIFLAGRGFSGRAVGIIAVVASLPLLATAVFPTAISSIQQRFEAASQSENLGERIASVAIGRNSKEPHMFGQGIGMANNASTSLLGRERQFLIGETEFDRLLGEGGMLGAFFTVIKVAIAAVGMLSAILVLRRERSALPVLLWAPAAMVLATGQLTSQLSVHALGWLLIGLAWGSLNKARPARHGLRRRAFAHDTYRLVSSASLKP